MEKLNFLPKLWLVAFGLLFFASVSTAVAQQKSYVKEADEFYKNMQEKNYEAMYQSFNDKMKSELSFEDLKENIDKMYVVHGKILKNDSLLIRALPPYMITILPIYFEKSNLELRLAFDTNFKVGGLFFTVFEPRKNAAPKTTEKPVLDKGDIKVRVKKASAIKNK